jgi:hypothetical protein
MQQKAFEYLEMNGLPVNPYTMSQVTMMAHQQFSASVANWQGASDDDLKAAVQRGDVGAAVQMRERAANNHSFFASLFLPQATDNWIKQNAPSVASAIGLGC